MLPPAASPPLRPERQQAPPTDRPGHLRLEGLRSSLQVVTGRQGRVGKRHGGRGGGGSYHRGGLLVLLGLKEDGTVLLAQV